MKIEIITGAADNPVAEFFSSSSTPETDAKASPHIGFYSCATVPAEFARQLERERDKARKTLSGIYRWVERRHTDGFIDSLTHEQNLERVYDAIYERIDALYERLRDTERERDEAREKYDLEATEHMLAVNKLCGERDEARKGTPK